MVSMQHPLSTVMSAWDAMHPGQPFPGKAAAVAALSGTSAPVRSAPAAAPAPTPAPGYSVDTAARLTQINDSMGHLRDRTAAVEAALRAGADYNAYAQKRIDDIGDRINTVAQTVTALDDRLAGEIGGLAGQVASLDSAIRRAAAERPAIDPATVAGQVAAAVREAFKPFEERVRSEGREVEVLTVADALPVAESDALTVFGVPVLDVKGRTAPVFCYAAPGRESPDPMYIWQESILRHLLLSQQTGENIWLGGEKGTGKSETIRQFAARTGRPYVRINFHKYSTAEEIIGAVGLNGGSTGFQPGPFLQAYTTPGCVILLDEITNADPGELAILNGLLEPGAAVNIGGTTWRRAPGVLICAADNTLTHGDQSGRYSGTRQMNSALADRFARIVHFDFLPLSVEVEAVCRHTGCAAPLAEHILGAVTMARSKVSTGDIIDAPSIRSVVAFVRALSMMPVREAWNSTIAARQPQESALALQGIFEACINPDFINANL